MASNKSNILIINHGFPPNPGIGGRRWAKFAKYLSKENYSIYVLASKNIHHTESEWKEDIKNINVEYLSPMFPEIFTIPKKGILNTIQYKIWVFLLSMINPGNFYDKSFFWGKTIQKKITEYIKEKNIKTVIVTSAPFVLSYYVTALKKDHPNVKFIVDFRDLWTTDLETSAFSALSSKRSEKEKQLEKITAENSDVIITVNDKISNYYKKINPKTKIVTIPNGFDEDDFSSALKIKPDEPSELIKLVFTGTLYINMDYIIVPFLKGVSELRTSNPEIFEKIRFEFYGSFPKPYLNLINEYRLQNNFIIKERIPLQEVYSKIINSTACMLFLNDVYNFALSTKFCEYISQNKKIIVIANDGPTSKFITDNKLGYWISPSNVKNDLLKMIDGMTNNNQSNVSDFDISQFSLPVITKNLIKIIEE